MTFGEKLQSLRQKAGMSQDALAEKLDVSRQAVSRWERNETMPETEKVILLADLFGVTTDYLLRPEVETAEPTRRELSGRFFGGTSGDSGANFRLGAGGLGRAGLTGHPEYR